jgi:hypothetical protein
LSIGAIATEQSERGTAGLSQTSLQASDSYMSAHTDTGESQLLAQY